MSSEKERPPVPLDPFGNELCRLFLKFGKCRYKKKCKLSHILPDKNAPIVQVFSEPVVETPQPTREPSITFSIKRTPYSRPTSTLVDARFKEPRKISTDTNNVQDIRIDNGPDSETTTDRIPTSLESVENSVSSNLQPTKEIKSKKSRPKRSLKKSSTPLLASLFKTPVPPTENKALISADTYVITLPQGKNVARTGSSIISPRPNKKFKSSPTQYQGKSSTLGHSSNTFEPNNDRIEQWYITNNAHMEILPKSIPGRGGTPRRRLMTRTKPTSLRQKTQLKIMRKHHWECRLAIEKNLQMNTPNVYSLKIQRARIDWKDITPYITLMIQAAFRMDVTHQDLPTIGTTLCVLLEHKDLSAGDCEKLLALWGLTELDARRFTNHLWEVLMSAAGEANIRVGKGGIGYRVRQFEHMGSFKHIQSRLLALNKSPPSK